MTTQENIEQKLRNRGDSEMEIEGMRRGNAVYK